MVHKKKKPLKKQPISIECLLCVLLWNPCSNLINEIKLHISYELTGYRDVKKVTKSHS